MKQELQYSTKLQLYDNRMIFN